ncbi:hypothetical protein AGMMS50239_29720 [Bacteroidia bacterium]|nr:hypothetical protein AGMMS50239_29720 [Bacteroidia bacterium]
MDNIIKDEANTKMYNGSRNFFKNVYGNKDKQAQYDTDKNNDSRFNTGIPIPKKYVTIYKKDIDRMNFPYLFASIICFPCSNIRMNKNTRANAPQENKFPLNISLSVSKYPIPLFENNFVNISKFAKKDLEKFCNTTKKMNIIANEIYTFFLVKSILIKKYTNKRSSADV